MPLTRILACCFAFLLAAGCKAQTSAPGAPTPSSQLDRRIEVVVRSQFEVPPNVDVNIGTPTKSEFPGYQNLPITFSSKAKQTTVNFLLSNDGNTIARLEKFDISHSPMEIISLEHRPVRGLPTAKVTIVNFDDLECPYCAQMHAMLFPATADRYKGLVRFIYKDFPLVEIHPWAMHAAIDANCLASQSEAAYWNFVDYAHSHAEDITGPAHDVKQSFKTLDSLAHDLGQREKIDLAKLDACTAKQDASAVQASMKQGDALGVNGTPTLFVNGERLSGMMPKELLWTAIDRALKEQGVQPPQVAEAPNKAATTQSAPQQNK